MQNSEMASRPCRHDSNMHSSQTNPTIFTAHSSLIYVYIYLNALAQKAPQLKPLDTQDEVEVALLLSYILVIFYLSCITNYQCY